ncbi:amidohydrolase family protein [Amnibacterium flavum]|uniref:Amidohydrolase n=1 Tax=Amnibacterium flavum TaxID=2173173 RepID=A0A2V1HQR5_9MICO|nr:amidohydrolase family protein [Amnibacterium flavum]PVZ93469.1 amidohydrolase [Amnibacterium flavum]
MIDAHLHVWRIDRGDYDWLADEDASLRRDFSLADWAEAAASTPVDSCVIVQATPTRAETHHVLAVARDNPDRVRGVVGWVDFERPEAPDEIASLAADPLLVALRPWLQAIADPDWILGDQVGRALDALEQAGLVYESLIKPVHLTRISELARTRPGLSILVDHGAKPDIAADGFEPWARDLRDLASASDRVVCKLSGLLTEAGTRTSRDELEPYIATILDAFGPDRVLWGSDWPVVTTVASYADWFAMAHDLVPAEHRDAVFGGTASRIYGLDAADRLIQEVGR